METFKLNGDFYIKLILGYVAVRMDLGRFGFSKISRETFWSPRNMVCWDLCWGSILYGRLEIANARKHSLHTSVTKSACEDH